MTPRSVTSSEARERPGRQDADRSHPTLPLGIAQIGLGGFARVQRIGYLRHGLPVVGGLDPDPGAQAVLREQYPAARVYADVDELLDDPAVDVIDLAVPHLPDVRWPILQRLLAEAGRGDRPLRPVLVQKPLATTYAHALEIAEAVEAAGAVVMVNQSTCFSAAGRLLTRAVLDDDLIGRPFLGQLTMQYLFDPPPGTWLGQPDRWWTASLTSHHLAMLHQVLGPPDAVFAVVGRDPGQPGVRTDGFGQLTLLYPGGAAVSVTSTGAYYGVDPVPHEHEKFWLQGDRGILDWRPDAATTLSWRAGGDPGGAGHADGPDGPEIRRRTLEPDGPTDWTESLARAMDYFQHALAAGVVPLCSVADNLYVVAVIEAAHRSGATGQPVRLADVMGPRWDPAYGPGRGHGFTDWAPATEGAR